MSKLFNHSKLVMEKAEKRRCPRCNGYGGCFPHDGDGVCHICDGDGRVWMSDSGWTRKLWGKIGKSEKLY